MDSIWVLKSDNNVTMNQKEAFTYNLQLIINAFFVSYVSYNYDKSSVGYYNDDMTQDN